MRPSSSATFVIHFCTFVRLCFQLFCGAGAPYDEKITQRVLRGSDLTARDARGQTILHWAVTTSQSESNVKVLLNNGVDIAARDCQGRTARDLAEKQNKPSYIRLIDNHVIRLVKEKKFDQLERLILQNYDHLLDVTEGNKTLTEIAKKSSTKNIYEILTFTAPIQVGETGRFTCFWSVLPNMYNKTSVLNNYAFTRNRFYSILLKVTILLFIFCLHKAKYGRA